MISLAEREQRITWINEARANGARLNAACAEADIDARTYQRWQCEGVVRVDGRPTALRPIPPHALSDAERAQIIATANESRFASLPPSQIVPRLADEGVYLASESTFYRVLRAADQQHHRGRARSPVKRVASTHAATQPNAVWCWDITYLPSGVRGMWFYLYLIVDLYSRKIVGWEIHDQESGEHASALLRRSCLAEAIATQSRPLVLHADNGAPMKSATLLSTLQFLGVAPSYSRPRVSDDNAYVESLFRTCKYRPNYPAQGFATIETARAWVMQFVHWYNSEHRHSGIAFVTPSERHGGRDVELLKQRTAVYTAAKQRHPQRWSGDIREWKSPDVVWLNPERELCTESKQAA